jgi:glutamate-5-semialdehyde dehydrogenase
VIQQTAQKARQASLSTAALTSQVKNDALAKIGEALMANAEEIINANGEDLAQAEKDNLNQALLKRLKFGQSKLDDVVEGINQLIRLGDPVGRTLGCTEMDKNLELYQVTSPIGVLGIIFESRPDALVQISTLALKSGNAVLLKGGSEAVKTNRALADVIYRASVEAGMPEHWMALLETRQDVNDMLAQDESIDLIIPRGSNAFVKYIMDNTRIMVLGHADGICHVYIDKDADLDMGVNIAFDAKCQYAAVCNAMETLLVDMSIAAKFLPRIKEKYDAAGVELRGDAKTCDLIAAAAAAEEDWQTEYNDLILSIKIVNGVDQAINHINGYSSHHTDSIVTESAQTATEFMNRVDSAGVYWNASTRFADGFRYGLGAEVGISTHKIHARGPVGLEGLVSYKWKLIGKGHTAGEYSGGKQLNPKKLNKTFTL